MAHFITNVRKQKSSVGGRLVISDNGDTLSLSIVHPVTKECFVALSLNKLERQEVKDQLNQPEEP